jgi:hypothetical protein
MAVLLIDNSRTLTLRTDNSAVSTKPERTRTSEASVTSTSPASRRGRCTSSRRSQGLPSGVRYVRSGKCRPTGAAAAMPSTHATFAHVGRSDWVAGEMPGAGRTGVLVGHRAGIVSKRCRPRNR